MSRTFRPKPAPLMVGEQLPAACRAIDLRRAFGVSVNTIYDWHKAGKLRRFELRKRMGTKRWSGRLVQEFLDRGTGPTAVVRGIGPSGVVKADLPVAV